MSTPTHRKKRARTTGNNATVAVATATTNNDTIQLQDLVTTQVNAMKNEFDVKLSQVTNIQRDQQYQLEILRGENTKLVKRNDELQLVADENKKLRRELKQMKEKMDSKMNEMKNEFKKQLDDLKKKDSTDSPQEVQSRLSNINVMKELSLHNFSINDIFIFTSKNNEKMVATAFTDGYIRITRLSDNKVVKTISKAHSLGVKSLVMTKINNNEVIASCGYDKMVKFWNIDNFDEVVSFKCNCDFVLSLAAYELNGRYMIACGVYDGLIELWDVQSKKKVDTLEGHDDGKCCYELLLHTFKHNNKTYLSSGDSYAGKLNLWCLDDESNKLVKTLCSYCNVLSLATFELDEDLLIAASVGKEVMLWEMNNLELYHQFNLQDDSAINGLKPFLSDRRAMLASVNEGGWFHVLDVTEKKVVYEFKCEDHKFKSLYLFEEGGNCVFIAGGESEKTNKGFMVFLK